MKTILALRMLAFVVGAIAAAAAPASATSPTKVFIVFFSTGMTQMTEEAVAVVKEAAAAVRSGAASAVKITGHTDTSEENAAALSRKRAEAVRDEMVRQGVPASVITVGGSGADDPMRPTGPGVREPMNRRVVIELLN